MDRIDKKANGRQEPSSDEMPCMLKRYLNESHGVHDHIHQWGKQGVRKAALDGWNKVNNQQNGRMNKGHDMMRRLERYMDVMTDAGEIQRLQEEMYNGGGAEGTMQDGHELIRSSG